MEPSKTKLEQNWILCSNFGKTGTKLDTFVPILFQFHQNWNLGGVVGNVWCVVGELIFCMAWLHISSCLGQMLHTSVMLDEDLPMLDPNVDLSQISHGSVEEAKTGERRRRATSKQPPEGHKRKIEKPKAKPKKKQKTKVVDDDDDDDDDESPQEVVCVDDKKMLEARPVEVKDDDENGGHAEAIMKEAQCADDDKKEGRGEAGDETMK